MLSEVLILGLDRTYLYAQDGIRNLLLLLRGDRGICRCAAARSLGDQRLDRKSGFCHNPHISEAYALYDIQVIILHDGTCQAADISFCGALDKLRQLLEQHHIRDCQPSSWL